MRYSFIKVFKMLLSSSNFLNLQCTAWVSWFPVKKLDKYDEDNLNWMQLGTFCQALTPYPSWHLCGWDTLVMSKMILMVMAMTMMMVRGGWPWRGWWSYLGSMACPCPNPGTTTSSKRRPAVRRRLVYDYDCDYDHDEILNKTFVATLPWFVWPTWQTLLPQWCRSRTRPDFFGDIFLFSSKSEFLWKSCHPTVWHFLYNTSKFICNGNNLISIV